MLEGKRYYHVTELNWLIADTLSRFRAENNENECMKLVAIRRNLDKCILFTLC